MENEENQNQVSLRFPPPLEIAPRFPQSHNPDDDSPLPKTQNQKARKEPQRLKKPQPPSSGSSFDEKMLIYRLDLTEVLEWYGIRWDEIWQDFESVAPAKTHLVNFTDSPRGSVALPLQLDPGTDFRKTTYLSRAIQQWGRVPLSLLGNLNINDYRYGLIGADDYLMYPMLRPGALVQIDERRSRRSTPNSSPDPAVAFPEGS